MRIRIVLEDCSMALSRMQIAKADILAHFDQLPQKLLHKGDIARILTQQRSFWRLAQNTNTDALIEFLRRVGKLRTVSAEFPDRATQVHVWGEDSPTLEILQALRPRTYFSHYTALRFHGLTEQSPKTVYLTEEPLNAAPRHTPLTQGAIDGAFAKPVRTTNKIAVVGDLRVCLLHGSSSAGVIEEEMTDDAARPARIRITNLERTLIDATVRPVYTGGVAEVLKAFREARGRVSVNRLRALLEKMEFLYPYHQAVGFYLERAEYAPGALKLFRELPQVFDFYLTHDMGATDFVPQWRLHVPRGF